MTLLRSAMDQRTVPVLTRGTSPQHAAPSMRSHDTEIRTAGAMVAAVASGTIWYWTVNPG